MAFTLSPDPIGLTVYGLDIETDTSPETAEELAAGFKPGNRGLDSRIGSVLNVAVAHAKGEEVFDGEERDVLHELGRFFLLSPVGLIATWNGAVFDMPFLSDRYDRNKMDFNPVMLRHDPRVVPKYDPLPGHLGGYQAAWAGSSRAMALGSHSHVDMAYVLKDRVAELGVAWSLKPVSEHFGIPMITVARDRVHELSKAERDAYVASDARGTRELCVRSLTGRL